MAFQTFSSTSVYILKPVDQRMKSLNFKLTKMVKTLKKLKIFFKSHLKCPNDSEFDTEFQLFLRQNRLRMFQNSHHVEFVNERNSLLNFKEKLNLLSLMKKKNCKKESL